MDQYLLRVIFKRQFQILELVLMLLLMGLVQNAIFLAIYHQFVFIIDRFLVPKSKPSTTMRPYLQSQR